MTSSYAQWAAQSAPPDDPEIAYDLYLAAHAAESRQEFDDGCHDYTDFAEFLADDPPTPWREVWDDWWRDQDEIARERQWGRR